MTNLSIVIPCYNEEQVLSEACLRLLVFMEKMIKKGQGKQRKSSLFD